MLGVLLLSSEQFWYDNIIEKFCAPTKEICCYWRLTTYWCLLQKVHLVIRCIWFFLYIHKNIYIYMWYQYPVVLDVSFLLMFMHITCLNFSFSNMIYIYTYMCHINVLSLLIILVKGCDMLYNFLFISCFVFSKSISLEIFFEFFGGNIYVFPILVFWPGDNNALFVFCIKWIYWIVIFTLILTRWTTNF